MSKSQKKNYKYNCICTLRLSSDKCLLVSKSQSIDKVEEIFFFQCKSWMTKASIVLKITKPDWVQDKGPKMTVYQMGKCSAESWTHS